MTLAGKSASPLHVLDEIERDHHEQERERARILSAAAWTPDPKRLPWWRRWLTR